MMVREIERKQEAIEELKEYLSAECAGPETKLLQSIKGIGAYSAAAIMIQIEDIKRFSSPKALASYFGLHPTLRESGDKQSKSRMSKQGRPAVRATLYMCANTAVLFDTHMKQIYARHRANGKNHNQALGVIMHKILRVVWGVLNSGKEYDSTIDQNKILLFVHTHKSVLFQTRSLRIYHNSLNNFLQHTKSDIHHPK
jgi:transposase